VSRKTDMAARYAAAHARREQRRGQAPAREYLPLAEEHPDAPISGAGGVAARMAHGLGRSTAGTLTSRLPAIDYTYLRADLIRIATLAVILFAAMIILHLFVH